METKCRFCRKRLPDDRELGWIRRTRRDGGQKLIAALASKLEFCTCPKVFIKSQWLREDLKVKVVLSVHFRKDRGKAVEFLDKIPRWLKGNRFPPRTDKTLRRITAFGDEFLYGCEFWPGHPDWLLGEMIESSVFHRMLAVTAPLRPPKPNENTARLELERIASSVSYFVSIYPLTVSCDPPTAADEQMTRVYERAYDDYPGDPWEATEVEAGVVYEDPYSYFSDRQKWTDEQVLNLEHEKAFELKIAMGDAFAAGLFEYIPWPPKRPNPFSAHLGPRLDVCSPSPQYTDRTSHSMKCDAALKCWNALFSLNRKSHSTV